MLGVNMMELVRCHCLSHSMAFATTNGLRRKNPNLPLASQRILAALRTAAAQIRSSIHTSAKTQVRLTSGQVNKRCQNKLQNL